MNEFLLVGLICNSEDIKKTAKKQRKVNFLITLNLILFSMSLSILNSRIKILEQKMITLKNVKKNNIQSEDKKQKGE